MFKLQNPLKPLKLHRLAFAFTVPAALACAVVGLWAARADQQQHETAQRTGVSQELATVKARLEGLLGATASLSSGLAHVVEAENGTVPAATLDRMARAALQANPHIRGLSAAPGHIVSWSYPRDGRPGAPGTLAAERLEGVESVFKAHRLRLAVLAGPTQLAEGGPGLVLRTPVFLDDGARYWGVLNVVTQTAALSLAAGIGDGPVLRVAWRNEAGEQVAGDPTVFNQAPVLATVQVPGGQWHLAAVPTAGWTHRPLTSSPYFGFGLLASMLLSAVLVLLGVSLRRSDRHDSALHQEVQVRKTAEDSLKLAGAAFSSSSEAIVIMNARFEVMSVNPAFSEISGYAADEVEGAIPHFLDAQHGAGAQAQAILSSLQHAGKWRGEILSLRKSGERYPTWVTINAVHNDSGNAGHYVAVCSDISVIKQTEQELDRLAHYDILTALPNRLLFRRRLVQVIGAATPESFCALLLLDIDGFKGVNDSFGHHVGDRLLCEIATRLLASVRGRDTVARLGGDEFAVILTGLTNRDRVIEAASRIIRELQAPFQLDDIVVNVSVSIGIACCPEDGVDEVLLTRNADAAMYAAKEGGRSTYRFYNWEMTRAVRDRLLMEQRMREGLEQGHFEVWFQPRVDIATGRLIGAEGLVRWRDPEQGLISPATFIPLAERSPLIFALGRTVIEQVVAHAQRWHAAGLAFGKLSMNVATPQIDRADLAGELRQILADVDVPRSMLEIEVTESLFMADAERARRTLNDIRALGLSIAIDDFGTGYSSLAYLKTLPINHLKIDRAFVKDLPEQANDGAIVRAILSMSRSLGFQVTAEGVETEAQLQFLREEGCQFAQGFLFHKPMPAAEFEQLLRHTAAAAPSPAPAPALPLPRLPALTDSA